MRRKAVAWAVPRSSRALKGFWSRAASARGMANSRERLPVPTSSWPFQRVRAKIWLWELCQRVWGTRSWSRRITAERVAVPGSAR